MTNTLDKHWYATARILRSSVTKDNGGVENFSNHVFAHNTPLEHEILLMTFFGFLESYFAGLSEVKGANQIQELWLGLWDDWKDMFKMSQKVEEFGLLNTLYSAAVRGSFTKEAQDRNSQSATRKALVAMASTPGTTGILPMVACGFLEFAFDLCDESKATIFRQEMRDAVNHVLK